MEDEIKSMKLTAKRIKEEFAGKEIIFTKDLLQLYQADEPGIKKSTANWRIYQLVRKGILQRIGKGKFIVGETTYYLPEIFKNELKINNVIKKEFYDIKYCIWNSALLGEFLQHQLSLRFTVVEVERDVLDAVFYSLKENINWVFKKPDKELMEEFVVTQKNSVIIKPFISEAPIQLNKTVPSPSLEKLLVDVYCDKKLFFFLQGYELVHVFRNAFDKYTINKSKLLRYANRRKKMKEINEFIKSIIP